MSQIVSLLRCAESLMMYDYLKCLEDDLKSTITQSDAFKYLELFDNEFSDNECDRNLALACIDIIVKEYKSNLLEDQLCYDSDISHSGGKDIGSENQIHVYIDRQSKLKQRTCCSHDNEGRYLDPKTKYKVNNQIPCYYYTLHHQPIPDDAYVGRCCCHRHKKFYDNISQLSTKNKLLIMDRMRG